MSNLLRDDDEFNLGLNSTVIKCHIILHGSDNVGDGPSGLDAVNATDEKLQLDLSKKSASPNLMEDTTTSPSANELSIATNGLGMENECNSIGIEIGTNGKRPTKVPLLNPIIDLNLVNSIALSPTSNSCCFHDSDQDVLSCPLVIKPKAHKIVAKQCPTCSKTLSNTYSLMRHQKTHIRSKVDLSSHVNKEEMPKKIKTIQCPYCPKRYCNKFSLKRHLKMHGNDSRETEDETEKAFQCEICNERFWTKGHLKYHMTDMTVHPPSG